MARNLGLALGKRRNHGTVLCQRGRVAVSVFQHHRINDCFKTVSMRAVARLQAQYLDRYHGVAVQRHQPVRGPHKIHAGPAGQFAVRLQLVTHDFGNRQQTYRLLQRFLQPGVECGARDQAVKKQRLGLAIWRTFERGHSSSRVRHVGAKSLQLFQQCRGRVARRVKSHSNRHELLPHGLVGRLEPDVSDMRRQPARRRKGRNDRVRCGQALCCQLFCQLARERITQLIERLRRQLFHK